MWRENKFYSTLKPKACIVSTKSGKHAKKGRFENGPSFIHRGNKSRRKLTKNFLYSIIEKVDSMHGLLKSVHYSN